MEIMQDAHEADTFFEKTIQKITDIVLTIQSKNLLQTIEEWAPDELPEERFEDMEIIYQRHPSAYQP